MQAQDTKQQGQTASTPQRSKQEARTFISIPGIGEMELVLTNCTPSWSVTGDGSTQDPKERIPTYDLVFTSVVPEALGPVLLAALRDHRLRLQPLQPDEAVSK